MKARKKPVEIDFYPAERHYIEKIQEWSTKEQPIDVVNPRYIDGNMEIIISTIEGKMKAIEGRDVVIKGINGEVYPCKKEIFEKTYELV